jgi:hypothetical protein
MKKYPRISQRISELIKIEWEKILQDAKSELEKNRDSNLKDQELDQDSFYWISFLLLGFIILYFFLLLAANNNIISLDITSK